MFNTNVFRRYGDNQFRFFSWIHGQLVFKPNFRLGIDLFAGDSEKDVTFSIGLFFFCLYLTFEDVLPTKWQPKVDWDVSFGAERTITFYYFERAFWFALWQDQGGSSSKQPWYMKMRVFNLPWDKDWVRTSKMRVDGTWFDKTYKNRMSWKEKNAIEKQQNLWTGKYPYKYVLKSGKEQNVEATISVEEREWRWRWFKWLPFTRSIQRTIHVEFSNEVGEETGSWKGGTTGCSYLMLPNETPAQCLRRMEKERKFER